MREKKQSSGIGLKIAMAVCILVIVISASYLIHYVWESRQNSSKNQATAQQYIHTSQQQETTDSSEAEQDAQPQNPVDFAALQAVSSDVTGWIQVAGLDAIDYPVVWHEDDVFYLDHTWDGQSSRYGAIFMETGNAADFSDCYTIVYGHNMKDGSMFGSLKKYQSESFYGENGGEITLYLPGEIRTYQIFSVQYVDPADEAVYLIGFEQDDIFGAFLQTMKERSLYDTGVDVSAQDSVITLSTCANGGADRFVVHAKLISSTESAN